MVRHSEQVRDVVLQRPSLRGTWLVELPVGSLIIRYCFHLHWMTAFHAPGGQKLRWGGGVNRSWGGGMNTKSRQTSKDCHAPLQRGIMNKTRPSNVTPERRTRESKRRYYKHCTKVVVV